MNSGYATAPYPVAPRPARRRGPSGLAHAMVVVGAWALAAVVTLAIMAETKVGPVVVTLTRNHGLHAGDVLAFVVMSFLATVVTIAVGVHFAMARRRQAHRYRR